MINILYLFPIMKPGTSPHPRSPQVQLPAVAATNTSLPTLRQPSVAEPVWLGFPRFSVFKNTSNVYRLLTVPVPSRGGLHLDRAARLDFELAVPELHDLE